MDAVVPEGFEDLSCEGSDGWHVQVKSRQARVGDFAISDVAEHLLALFTQHAARIAAGVSGRPVLVVERAIDGLVLAEWDIALSAQPEAARIIEAVLALARRREQNEDAVREFCRQVTVFVLPWTTAADEARDAIARRFSLVPAAADPIVRAFRDEVAASADVNTSPSIVDRRGIDRTRAESIATALVGVLDNATLERALATGACEPVDFDTPLASNGFYEGMDVQPGHVVAGLPTPRPSLTGEVVTGLDRRGRVLVTGPSGVGKSTVMWAAAYSTRHALWYRVRRLQDEDVAAIVDLASASMPSSRSPIGFIVDGVAVGPTQAWDSLVRAFAGIPHVLLLGSARTEDLLTLRTLPECDTTDVVLDEEVAAHIHAALVRSGATTATHWREAYEDAAGLTLEYTHLLTRGRRLSDVITEQVRRRVSEGRETELRLVALVATAHRWSANLDIRDVQRHLHLGDPELREALARLRSEHLVDALGTRLVGLHQLRSVALSDAVHTVPPPVLIETVRDVLALLDEPQLRPFVVGVLRDVPQIAGELLTVLAHEVERRSDARCLASVLDALRIADFRATAQSWARSLEANAVAPAQRAITIQLALMGSHPQIGLRPEIESALPGMALEPLALRDEFLDMIGNLRVSRFAAGANLPGAMAVFGALAGRQLEAPALTELGRANTALAECLQKASADDLAEVLAVAREVSLELATTILEMSGGRQSVFDRLLDSTPGLVEVAEHSRGGVRVAYARILHVSDVVNPEPDDSNRAFARRLLRCLPACDKADVQTLLPGDVPLGFRDHVIGVSTLERRYDHSDSAVQWTRVRAQIAASAAGTIDHTTRLATVTELVGDTARFLDDLTLLWCVSQGRPDEERELEARRTSIRERADTLTVPIDRIEVTLRPGAQVPNLDNDHFHSFIQGVVDNLPGRLQGPADGWPSLAAFTGDTLRRDGLRAAQLERWDLVDSDPPGELQAMDQQLSDLHAVLAELAWGQLQPRAVAGIARSGPYTTALRRAAGAAREMVSRRTGLMLDGLKELAGSLGIELVIWTRDLEKPDAVYWPPTEVAIGVPATSPEAWMTAAEALRELIEAEYAVRAARPPILITPLVGDRPVRQAAVALQTTAFPGADLLATWSDQIGRPAPTPLTDCVIDAHGALESLSGLHVLARRRSLAPDLAAYRDSEHARLRMAMDRLADLSRSADTPGDIQAYLADLEVRVLAEDQDAKAPADTLAGRIAASMTLASTTEANERIGLIFESLRWDLWRGSIA
ncbi:hypothetical protein ATJ88_2044 [Isoptericola jiangsuensis]|uniref:Uncharacterized protein n=1 Tax=Isoptericola jiangsuensis TaxID=548579 RepID=A0A2A9EWV9_9MICO|nr:hypothetical protein ATJ88_2044 [Isoptericola jiangsuensis]